MARRIRFPDVRLDLDNRPARAHAATVVHEDLANQIASDVEEAVPISELKADHANVNAKLRTIGEHTGAMLLDPLPDICGTGDGCSPFFGAGEPKFSDTMHLRPAFVREHLRFLDPLLK